MAGNSGNGNEERGAVALPAAPRRPWWRQKWFWWGLTLFVLFVALPEAIAIYLIQEEREYPRFFWYRITAQLEYRGEVVNVGGVLECQRGMMPEDYWIAPFVPLWDRNPDKPDYQYYTNTIAFGQRLADGSGLVMRHGMTCNSHMHRRLTVEMGEVRVIDGLEPLVHPSGIYQKYTGGLPRFPLVHWLDNAAKPTRAETYFADVYYTDPRARFKFLGLTVQRLGRNDVPAPGYMMAVERERLIAELPWAGAGEPMRFQGIHGHTIDISELQLNPETDRILSEVTSPADERLLKIPHLAQKTHSFEGNFAWNCLRRERWPHVRPECSILDKVHLFEPRGDTLVVSSEPAIPGLLPLYPYSIFARVINSKKHARVRFAGSPPFDSRGQGVLYDQASGQIYQRLVDWLTPRWTGRAEPQGSPILNKLLKKY